MTASENLLRIAIITTSYPQRAGDPAGHFIEAEAFDLSREGHEVHVVAPGVGSTQRVPVPGATPITVWKAGGPTLFGFPGALARARERPLRLLELARFLPAVRRIVRRLAPLDRVVAHFLVPSGYPLALGAGGHVEVVLHGSDVRLVMALPFFIRQHIVFRLLLRGAQFRFVAEELRSRLLAALSPAVADRLRIVSRIELPRISLPAAGPRLERDPQAASPPRWVVCARLVASKRVDLAIREAARQSARLTVIGDGPLRKELEELAASLSSGTRFTGHLLRHEALAVIADAHKLVHLSEAEGAPTVIREARALGVPVLATAVGDVAHWAARDPGIEIFRPT